MRISRDEALTVIQRELTAFARRVRGRVHEVQPDLTFVAYALLDHIRATENCHAAELAGFFGLEKSTLSRQLTVLEREGLIERVPAGADRRVRGLQLTAEGERKLHSADSRLKLTLGSQLAQWPDESLDLFAALLARFTHDAA